jgi:hypothetical protein
MAASHDQAINIPVRDSLSGHFGRRRLQLRCPDAFFQAIEFPAQSRELLWT